jgi:hypothetical protein
MASRGILVDPSDRSSGLADSRFIMGANLCLTIEELSEGWLICFLRSPPQGLSSGCLGTAAMCGTVGALADGSSTLCCMSLIAFWLSGRMYSLKYD